MKKKILFKHSRHFFLIILSFIIFWSCEDPSELGIDLLPSSDLLNIGSVVEKDNIFAYTIPDDSIRTDEASDLLLGSINDPVFGNVTVGLASQFMLQAFPDFGESPVVDSVLLYLFYKDFYGDTITPQRLKIYELATRLDVDGEYYNNIDFSELVYQQLLADYEFTPKISVDTSTQDTIYQELKVEIDPSLGDKLISAQPSDMDSISSFLDFFNGLYFDIERVNEGGNLINVELISGETYGSALGLYYHNETFPDSVLFKAYIIHDLVCARVSQFVHDYSQSPFYDNLGQQSFSDSLIYLQSTGGLKSKIEIPAIDFWKDSVDIVINKAQLVFEIDTFVLNQDIYKYPERLWLTIAQEDGTEILPTDFYNSPDYYNGILNMDDLTYTFNITQHMQEIVNGESSNKPFYLNVNQKNSSFSGVVLKGPGSTSGIKLNIIYSKL